MSGSKSGWLTVSAAMTCLYSCAGEPASAAAAPDPAAIVAQCRGFMSKLHSAACGIRFVRIENSAHRYGERKAQFDMAFQRPNLISVLMKDDDAVTYAWISDGSSMFTYMAGLEKYTTGKAPPTLEQVLSADEMYVVKSALEEALLLDELLKADAKEGALPGGATAVKYIGAEAVKALDAHHLQWIRPRGNWDVWIAAGAAPIPLKVHADISVPPPPGKEETKTEFTVEFDNWHLDEALDANLFRFDPKSKAKRAAGFLTAPPPHPLLNTMAPDIVLDLGNSRMPLSAHRGKDIVVLDFWAIGCVPCVGMLPKIAAVAQKFEGRGVVVYGVNENDAPEDVRRFLKLKNVVIKPAFFNKETNFPAFKIESIPQTFIIDKHGTIRAVHGVLTNDLETELGKQLEALLAGRELPKPDGP